MDITTARDIVELIERFNDDAVRWALAVLIRDGSWSVTDYDGPRGGAYYSGTDGADIMRAQAELKRRGHSS